MNKKKNCMIKYCMICVPIIYITTYTYNAFAYTDGKIYIKKKKKRLN